MFRLFILAVVLCGLPLGARGAEGGLKLYFKSIGTREGLSHQMVNAIVKDSLGFVWIATGEGLNRYDGTGFRVFRHTPRDSASISTSWVNTLYITRAGELLVGTEKGVDRYDPLTERFEHLSAANDPGDLLGNLRIRCFLEDRQGILWIGTLDGLLRFDRGSGQISLRKLNRHDPDKMHNEVLSLAEDAAGRIWVGTFDGLYCREREGAPFVEVPLRRKSDANCLVSKILTDPDVPDRLWIAASNGLHLLDTHRRTAHHWDADNSALARNDVRDAVFYDADHLVVATAEGLSLFDIGSGTFENYAASLVDPVSLPARIVRRLFRDDKGMIWIGTDYGVATCDRHRRPIDIHYILHTDGRGGVARETVTDLAVLPEGRWVGTNNGLLRYDDRMRLVRRYTAENSPLPHNNIKRILIDRHGVMWIGTNNGVVWFDRARRTLHRVEPEGGNFSFKYVYDIKEDADGDIVVNISSGICFIRAERDAAGDVVRLGFTPMIIDNLVSSDNSDVPYFEPDREGRIWIGSISDGIFRYDKARGSIVQYRNDPTDAASIVSDRIYTIHTDALGRVWVGTDSGLCRYDAATDGFERIDTGAPLSVRTLVSDDDNRLWIATSGRLLLFDYELNYKIACDISQELKMNDIEYNSVCTADGRICMGGYGGYIEYRASDIGVDMRRYPVRLTSFRLHNEPVEPAPGSGGRAPLDRSVTLAERIRLRHDENFFRIDFALLNYAPRSENTYHYKLESYDKEWLTTDGEHGYASYSHIPPGRYVFCVNAVNADNIWSENTARIVVEIAPAWYRSWAACVVYVLLFAGLCTIAVRLVRARMRLARELKMEIVRRERDEELSRIKSAFFTNISHEFRTPLTLIIGPIENLMEGATEKQRAMLGVMRQNAERLLRLINQIMDMRKIDDDKMKLQAGPGDLAQFARAVFDSFGDHARQRRIDYRFEAHPGAIHTLFDRDKVEKMLYNLLSNAFKFTPDGGRIRLLVEVVHEEALGDAVRLAVEDTGCGIRPEECGRIFDRFYQTDNATHEPTEGTGIGLMLAKDYARLHGGGIAVESEPGRGSHFVVTIPLRLVAAAGEPACDEGEASRTEGDSGPSRERVRRLVVVEDNAQMIEFLRQTLGESYDIYAALDGEQGLETIRRTDPDLVVSDLMMPRMDGFELCRRVKQDAMTSHIPFIMLTAKSNEADRAESYGCGADAFISKPFSVKTLATRIQVLIESRIRLQELYRQRILSTPSEVEVESENDRFILQLVSIIEANFENPDFNIQMLCERIGCSYQYVYRKVKALTGETINDFMRSVKLKRAAQYLSKGDMRISEILYKSGFNSHSYFTKCFKEHFGMTPKEYVERQHADGSGAKGPERAG